MTKKDTLGPPTRKIHYLWMWVDDERECPVDDRWIHICSVDTAINFITEPPDNVRWEIISLDHDMGEALNKTGATILTAIQELVVTNESFICPRILIHTQNASVRKSMQTVAARTMKLAKEKGRLINVSSDNTN